MWLGGTTVSLRHDGFGEGDGWDRSLDYFTGAWTRTLHGLRQRFAAMPELGPSSDEGGEPLFVFILRPGPGWDAAKPLHEQTRILNHAAYLGALADRGVMPMGGPFADLADHRTGHLAIGVLRAPDLAVAERFLRADPAIQAGTFLYELRPWSATLPGAE